MCAGIVANPKRSPNFFQNLTARAGRFVRFWKKFGDRKSTRLNSSHVRISYAVFCLKKKKKRLKNIHITKKIPVVQIRRKIQEALSNVIKNLHQIQLSRGHRFTRTGISDVE